MQLLEAGGAVRPIYWSLAFKGLNTGTTKYHLTKSHFKQNPSEE